MKLANNVIVKTVSKHGGELVKYLGKNSPTILTGCAIAGAFVAVGLAIKGTKPALEHIEEAKKEHRNRIIILSGDERQDTELTKEELEAIELKPLEVVQAVWKDYVPTAIALAGTTACVIGAHSISAKRTAAMAALYTMSEQALKDYKDKAEEIVGKGKATQIRDAIAEDEMKRTYDPNRTITLGPGDCMCYDRASGRYFPSSMQKLKTVVAELQRRTAFGERVSKNDYYYEVGTLDGVQYGDDVGWCTENEIELEFTSSLMSDGTPVLAVGFKNQPTAWYYD